VDVLSAGSTNAGDIQVNALPFVLLQDCSTSQRALSPAGRVTSSTVVDVTVVDARGEIDDRTVRARSYKASVRSRRTWVFRLQ
jgi:hypothetical protein